MNKTSWKIAKQSILFWVLATTVYFAKMNLDVFSTFLLILVNALPVIIILLNEEAK